uniref:Uncharacterized protein n=1 Tax=Octopus bimaculoides TaxID=37653 RepID=A0A0L8HK57_OCTBM
MIKQYLCYCDGLLRGRKVSILCTLPFFYSFLDVNHYITGTLYYFRKLRKILLIDLFFLIVFVTEASV